MSVWHLRSNIIGQAIANIYKKLNWNVICDNHIWDYWTQFGKLIFAYKMWWDDKIIENDPITELNNLYVKFHDEQDKDLNIENKWRQEFLKLEKWDKENIKIWKKFIDYSMQEFKEIHWILWSKFDSYLWESFFVPMLDEIIKEIDEKIWSVWEWWAKIIKFKNLPTMMYVKSDWATLYSTRDFATLKYRINKLKVNKIVQVVWKEQSVYFKQLYKWCEMMWWFKWVEAVHAKNWLVSLPEWKMSTRKWRVVLLRKLINTWMEKTKELLETKES